MEDPRFEHAVIYLCAHSAEGAMGIILNRVIDQISFPELLEQLKIAETENCYDIPVHFGGPVETGRGFVLHTTDYLQDSTMVVNQSIALSATVDVLRDIAEGLGPREKMLALGYAGWGAGQLDRELKDNVWLTLDADEFFIFDSPADDKWDHALQKLRIDPAKLSAISGTA